MNTANRNYKDSLFTDYFSDKERLIDAYNALAGTDYPLTVDVEYAPLEKAIEKTLYYCHEHGIMNVYLERQGAEVRNMLITEWNDDEYREVIREEAIAEGIAKGRTEGRAEERAEVARGMKTKGFSGADIADITGLSEEVIAAL